MPTATYRPTASIYARLSKASTESNLSLSGMLDECRALSEAHGFDVIAEHTDDGVSGAVRNRKGFRAWLADGREGRADVLVTYHGDRLTREGANVVGRFLDVIEGKDDETGKIVRPPVRFMDTKGLDSEHGDAFRLTFLVQGEGARMERNSAQRRNKDTQDRLREKGRFTGGAIPYGTRVEIRTGDDGRTGRYLVEEPAEASRLHEIASRLIRGDSLRAVTAFANSQGWTTRRGYPWSRSSVRSTLLSEPSRRLVFDTSTARALADRLTSRGNAAKGKPGRPTTYLLLGLATCVGCGARLTTHAHTRDGKRYRRYTCPAVAKVTPCPERVGIAADVADALVEAIFLARFGRFEHMEPRVTLSGAEDLNAAEEAVRLAEDALLADLTPGNLAAAQVARDVLAIAKAQPVRRERILVPTGRTIRDVWEQSQIPERAALLADAMDSLIVRSAKEFPGTRAGSGRGGATLHPDRIGVMWRGADGEEPDYAHTLDYGAGSSLGPVA